MEREGVKMSEKINNQIINEMTESLGESPEVIQQIILDALKKTGIDNDDDVTFTKYELETYTRNIIEQCMDFISTMEYE